MYHGHVHGHVGSCATRRCRTGQLRSCGRQRRTRPSRRSARPARPGCRGRRGAAREGRRGPLLESVLRRRTCRAGHQAWRGRRPRTTPRRDSLPPSMRRLQSCRLSPITTHQAKAINRLRDRGKSKWPPATVVVGFQVADVTSTTLRSTVRGRIPVARLFSRDS